jgi:hypothetical protein
VVTLFETAADLILPCPACLANSLLLPAAVLCISGNISPGLAGLCLVYALDLTRYLKHGTAMASKTESDFNSVERVVQYLQVRVCAQLAVLVCLGGNLYFVQLVCGHACHRRWCDMR